LNLEEGTLVFAGYEINASVINFRGVNLESVHGELHLHEVFEVRADLLRIELAPDALGHGVSYA
jgi:hypothetical protein